MRSDEQVAKMLPCGVGRRRTGTADPAPPELERMFPSVASARYDLGCHAAHHVPVCARSHPAQAAMLARHAGASRFAYNQCLRLVTDALAAKRAEPQVKVPWQGLT